MEENLREHTVILDDLELKLLIGLLTESLFVYDEPDDYNEQMVLFVNSLIEKLKGAKNEQ